MATESLEISGPVVHRDAVQSPIASGRCEVLVHRAVNRRYRHVAVAASPAMLAAHPGQFFQLLCPGQGGGSHLLRRPMSVYRVDRPQGRIEFLYKVVGAGTQSLARLTAGELLDIVGPLGRGFRLESSWRRIVLLARGVGLATLAPLADAAAAGGIGVTAVLSANRRRDVMSVERFRDAGAEVVVVTDEDRTSEPARIEQRVRDMVAKGRCDMIATCGSERLLRLVRRICADDGVAGRVALEQQMACGMGMCHCCVRAFQGSGGVETRRVCVDGPVFDVRETMS